MKTLWKPLVLILVAGIMVADLFLDYRSSLASQGTHGQVAQALEASELNLPVGTQTGELAPDFTGVTLDGDEVSLSDLRGKTVLVNVFASWCAPCRLEAPHLVEVYNKLNSEDVVFIGLNLQETPDAVAGFRSDFDIGFPLILNQDGALTEIYRPIGLPTSWFIDSQGVVQYVHAGPITSDLLQQAIEDVQAGRQPDPFASAG